MSEATLGAAAPGQPVTFGGGRGELFRIAMVNTLLTALTLSIYRFWAKTRIRQFYWQEIRVDDDPLEYTGTGMELFLGFLIAMAVLVPVFMVTGAVQFFVAGHDPVAGNLIELATYVILFWLYGYAIYRARRYRLTRTLWRGIRFGQNGSTVRYAWLRFGGTLLVVLTLGVVVPWYHVALRRYEMTHTRFGFSRFDYAGRGRDLFRWWWPVLIPWAAVIVAVGVLSYRVYRVADAHPPGDGAPGVDPAVFATVFQSAAGIGAAALLFAALLAALLLGARYRVASLRYLFAVSSLEGVSFRSGARTRRVILYALTAWAITIVVLPAAVAMMFVIPVLGIVLAIVALLSIGVLQQVFYVYPLVRHVTSTLEVANLSALDRVVQATRDDPRFGEGLLDALDVDVGVA